MHVPELKEKLEQISSEGLDQRQIAEVAQAWVTGASLEAIAKRFFSGPKDDPRTETEAITTACRAIYKQLANAATWGLSALSKLGPSGLDYEKLPPAGSKSDHAGTTSGRLRSTTCRCYS